MKLTWQYIAGFFDGEGCISVPRGSKHTRGSLTCIMYQKRPEVLYKIQEFLTNHGFSCTVAPNQRDQYHLYIKDGLLGNLRFLREIHPYLIVKKVEAQDTLRFFTVFGAYQQ